MTWINYWLKYATFDEIKAEAKRRGMFPEPLAPASIYQYISGNELGSILPSKYIIDGKEYWTHRYIRDVSYKLISIEDVKRFLKWNLDDKEQYIADYYDCDNFSMQLAADAQVWMPGVALGIMDVPGHSKNICVTLDKKVWEIEPQSDAISELSPGRQVTLYLI